MEQFNIIYKILKILANSMKVGEFDIKSISHEKLGISKEYWANIVKLLIDNNYIEGASYTTWIGQSEPYIEIENIKITLQGLEYLESNSMMKKAANIAKGIIETII